MAGVDARLVAVTARRPERAAQFAAQHGVAACCRDLDEVLARPDVDAVDLCVPNLLHRPFAERAAAAGKHVICTKPLAAYVGQDLGADVSDAAVAARDRLEMWQVAVADAQAMTAAAAGAGVLLMYGENWVYAPAITRARELLTAAQATILEMRGFEAHSGSHSPFSMRWRDAGGGALIRLGAHPIGAMLELKRAEGLARNGRPIEPVAVSAEVADHAKLAARAGGESFLAQGFVDVESWGCAIVSFADGAHGVASGSDGLLGGMESRLSIMASNSHFECDLSPNDMLRAYAPAASTFGDEYIMEKASTTAGWSTPMADEDWTSGQLAMCEDFAAAIAGDRAPRADGALGVAVTRVVYAAYAAAATGQRMVLNTV